MSGKRIVSLSLKYHIKNYDDVQLKKNKLSDVY